MKNTGARVAFTLVELIVTIAIISILAALLLPAAGSARSAGDRTKAIASMRTIGGAIGLYAADKNGFFPGRLWPGQIAELDPNIDGRLARELAPYLGIETPTQPKLLELFMPPAYRKVTAPAALSTSRTFVMNMKVASGNTTINPWGSRASNDGSMPLRLGCVPANAWGFSDADRLHPRVVSASWAANTPAAPVHGKRLAWFFNGSVAPVETAVLQ
jgi:prepilin-type N-terminal cleavage/methylation domain-containing protein